MIKTRIKLHRFNALGIGLSAACLALACGNDDTAGREGSDPEVEPGPVDECEANPYLQDCPGNEGSGGSGSQPGMSAGGDDGGKDPSPRTPQEEALDRAQNILLSRCGSCHGTQLNDDTAEAGMNYINDMDQLAKNKKIIPLDAEGSPIIQLMRAQAMPPPDRGGRPVAKAEIDIVANYINNPDFWPDVPKATCNDNPAMSFDDLYQNVANDLRDQEIEDRPFIRYISLDNRAGAGVCTNTTLDIDRQALSKMINSLSVEAKIAKPGVANPTQTLYRIDIRDMRWDRAITVDGEQFADVWEAIASANLYAVPFEGDAADDARADAVTEFPVMFLDSMLDVAMIGNLYYAIIGVDVTQSIDAFVADQLGIDVVANLENEELVRAGTTQSIVSRQDRLIEGHELDDRPGFYYQAFDFNADVANDSIFQDPFGFNEGGREAIFSLPNGLFGYLIADADGALVQDSDILLDTRQDNQRAVTSVSCAFCHVGGLIPVVDEVRPIVEQTARVLIEDGTLSQEQLEQLQAVYLDPEAFAARVEEESEATYFSALRRADLPENGVEPISSVFLRFSRDITIKDAAGDLGIGDELLLDDLNLLDGSLGVLEGGKMDRDDFGAVYVDSLCKLSIANENRPQQAACDAAAALLDN